MPYCIGQKVRLRDKARNRYGNFYGQEVKDNVFTVTWQDKVQGRQRLFLNGTKAILAWVGDLKQASDKKGLR